MHKKKIFVFFFLVEMFYICIQLYIHISYIYTKNVLHCKKRKKEGDLDLVHYCARTYVKRFFFYANYMLSERNVGISFTVICGLLITWSFHNVGIWFNGRFNFEIIIVFSLFWLCDNSEDFIVFITFLTFAATSLKQQKKCCDISTQFIEL